MYLHRVAIKNFRSIKDLNVHLSPGLNVIVGENNIGKSSIIDAIRLAMGQWGATGNDSFWLDKDDFFRSGFNEYEKQIRIDLFFSNLLPEDMGLFVEALNYNVASPDKSTISIHYEANWNDESNRASIKRWGGTVKKRRLLLMRMRCKL